MSVSQASSLPGLAFPFDLLFTEVICGESHHRDEGFILSRFTGAVIASESLVLALSSPS